MRDAADRRAARRDPRPQRPRARAQRARHEPRAVAGRPAEEPRAPGRVELRRLAMVVDMPVTQLEQRHPRARGRPADAGRRSAAASTTTRSRTSRSTSSSSRASSSPTATCASTRTASLGAHLLGHVGEINARRAEGDEARTATSSATSIGQAGVEADATTRYLRGRDGSAQLTVDSRGRPTSAVEPSENPQPGSTLRLTIDISLQRAAERALRVRHRARAREPSAGRPTAARSSRSTRATAPCSRSPRTRRSSRRSTSSRDPRKLAPLQNEKVAREQNYPGLNRALSVAYPPGSTWKPVTALAAMQEHVLTPYSSLPCTPDLHGATTQTFKNWTPYVSQWIELPDRARRVVRHLLLPSGSRLLRPAREPRPCAPAVGLALRLRRADRHRRRPRGGGTRADAGVAAGRRCRARSTARSTAPGSRATRSRWRSARATST